MRAPQHVKVLGLVALLTIVAATTWASNPHFIYAISSLNFDESLVVSFKEAGLAQNAEVTYSASADGSVLFQCVNRGGKCPQASNKQEVVGPVSASATFSSGSNGQVTQSLTVAPPPSTLTCSGNQHAAVAQVSYTNIALSDVTNGVNIDVSPTALSATNSICP